MNLTWFRRPGFNRFAFCCACFRYNNPGLFPRIRKLKSIQPRTFEEDMAALDKKEKRRRNKEEKIRLAAEARQREEDEMKQRHAASSRKYLN